MVQLAILEIHPWGSTVAKLETPDRITFDFDPDVGLPWERVTAAAIEMREALLGIGLQSFPKTTGGKGLHVVVPMTPKLDWDAIKEFAKWVSERFAAAYPERFTTNMAKRAPHRPHLHRLPAQRPRRHRDRRLLAAARAGAPVATPLFWEEVENGRQARRLHRADGARPAGQAEIRPLGRNAHACASRSAPACARKSGFEPSSRGWVQPTACGAAGTRGRP